MLAFLLCAQGLSSSYKDENQRSGVVYSRMTTQTTTLSSSGLTANDTEILTNYAYTFPTGTRSSTSYVTVTLAGTILSNSSVSYYFRLTSQPSGAAMLFDGSRIIGDSTLTTNKCDNSSSTTTSSLQTILPNKYYSILILHNVGCSNQARSITLQASTDGTNYANINTSSLFTFTSSECRESYYGSTCAQQCTESQCSYNGQCRDGLSGNGTCNCISGYIGANCSGVCVRATTCTGHGKCLSGGTCQCDSSYTGSDCSTRVDVNMGSRSAIGVVFYGVCTIGFTISTIVQGCKMESRNPLIHICLLFFSGCKLAMAILVFINLKVTTLSNILLLLSVPIMSFVLQRGILQIQKQFKATSPTFKSKVLIISLIVAPLLLVAIACIGVFIHSENLFYWVCIPFAALSIWIFVFAISCMYLGMREPFEKMAELFPNLAMELKRARKFIVIGCFFFILEAFLTWFNVDQPQTYYDYWDIMYYAMIVIDVSTLVCVGLANDTILSDIFATGTNGDGGDFVPVGIATISGVQEESNFQSAMSTDTLYAPMYSACPSVYKNAERKYRRKGGCKRCGKFALVYFVFMAIVSLGITLYISPAYPVWSLNGMSFDGIDLLNLKLIMTPNVSIYNGMRIIWINVTNTELTLYYDNTSIGSASVNYQIIKAQGTSLLYPNVSISLLSVIPKATGLLGDILSPDGVMKVVAIGTANPYVMNLIRLYVQVECPQYVRVLPTMEIVRGCGECTYDIAKISPNIL